jgi:probable rRNA maturation factor
MDGDGRRRPGGAAASRTVLVSDEQSRPVDLERLRRLAGHVLADRGVPAGTELSVTCIDAAAMAALNGRHLGEHTPTDVLAFPMDAPGETTPDEPALLGDVVLCPEVAAAQAADRGAPAADELDLLLVHGILHLLGHDHVDEAERADMFGLTDALLASFAGSAAGSAP